MNVTLSLDEDLVKKVRKIAVDREALERSFERYQFKVGKRTW